MSDFHKYPSLKKHIWLIYIIAFFLLINLFLHNWIIGIVFTCLIAASFYYSLVSEKTIRTQIASYIKTLSYRVKKVGEEALLKMPIGIVLFDDDYQVEWSNPYMNEFVPDGDEETLVGYSLLDLNETLVTSIREDDTEQWVKLGDKQFRVVIEKEERLLYFFDETKELDLKARYFNEKTVLFIIYLDNYEDITQTMEDTVKSQLNSQVTTLLSKWSQTYGLYLKRTSQDRFLAVGTSEILEKLEENRFHILDEVREMTTETNSPLTLSIGVGEGQTQLPTLGTLAQSSLDVALGRGGDQVAIKDETGKVRFYGGKTNPMEKRTRVRARVISHALKGLIEASENVIIMGHKMPDMDSLGAAVGILNISHRNNIDGYIVFDPNDIHPGVQGLVQGIQEDEELWQHFIDPDEAEELITDRSLLVIVDTHRPNMVVSERLLNKTEYKVIIDHHRRGEEFIQDPTLVYMEPYASSTAELVTELLEYQPNRKKLSMLEATALLAGIIVDTKSFTLRTGARTFDAASYLRSKGADTVLVQRFLKEDLNIFIKRNKLIEKAELYQNTLAIAAATEENEIYDQVLLAQAADTLLTMNQVNASFVVARINDDFIGVSARSLGDVNVQVIMEQMGGGGHLTNAATQLKDFSVEEATILLKQHIDKYLEGRTST